MLRIRPWKIFLGILLVVALATLYTKHRNSKVEAEYLKQFTEACKFATSGLDSINGALNSESLSHVEKLKTIQESEWELGVASRYLESIERLSPGIHLNPPEELIASQFVKTYVDDTLEDAIYIGIAQEDYESKQNGTSDEGLRAIKKRLENVQSFCSEYLK